MSKTIYIGGRLESKEKGNVVTGANAILDDTKGKKQNVINKETDDELARLEQSKQDNLNFDSTPTEDSTNPVTSGGVYTAEKALSDAIEAILLLIPSAATALNKLVDNNTMNSSISTATATFRGTYNAVSDLGLTYQATHAQIEAALDALGLTADNNDFVFVQIPVSDQSQDIAKTERFKFNGTNWLYEYDLNTSGFTAAQWAAINSTITLALVQKLAALPTNAELLQALGLKQDVLTFDNAPTTDSNNPGKSGGIKNAIDTAVGDEAIARDNADTALSGLIGDEKTRAEGVEGGLDTRLGAVEGSVSTIQGVIPSEATSSNKLVDNSSMTTYIGTIIDNIDATFNMTSTDGHVTLAITQVNGVITSVQLTTSDIASAADLTLLAGRVTSAEGNITSLTTRMGTAEGNIMSLGGRMTTAEGNITSLGGRVSTNETDIANLQQLYNNLQQSKPVPVTSLPSSGQQQGVIYRLTGTTSYSDYMWNGSTWVLMATYNNAIDNTPTIGSDNLVTSGGVAKKYLSILNGSNIWDNKTIESTDEYIGQTGTYTAVGYNIAHIPIEFGKIYKIYGFPYATPSPGNPYCYKLLNANKQSLDTIVITEALTENFIIDASNVSSVAYLALSYRVVDDANIYIVDNENLIEKNAASEAEDRNGIFTYNILSDSLRYNIYENQAYDPYNDVYGTKAGYNVITFLVKEGEQILFKQENVSQWGYRIDKVDGTFISNGYIPAKEKIFTMPQYGAVLSITYKASDNVAFLLRESDRNMERAHQKQINTPILVKSRYQTFFQSTVQQDYVAWFYGCNFGGFEYHFGSSGPTHAGGEGESTPFCFKIDADGNKTILTPFGTLEDLGGRWAAADAYGISRDGQYMFSACLCQTLTSPFTLLGQYIYVFDKNLSVVKKLNMMTDSVEQMFGNIVETPDGHLVFTAYGSEGGDPTGLHVWRSNESIHDTWNLTFTKVKTFDNNIGSGVSEATLGYVGDKLVLITRVEAANSRISITENLEGSTGWSEFTNMGCMVHAPMMKAYNNGHIFPFAGGLCLDASTHRVPCIGYYDISTMSLIDVVDITKGEITGWGSYPSFMEIEDGIFAMMYYDDYSNATSTVYYQRVNTRYYFNIDYINFLNEQ